MRVHYISPYDSKNKNIGGAINSAIQQLNPDPKDWIVHIDQDAFWLLPDSKKQLEEILSTTNYDLLGPVTNRLAQRYQLAYGYFDQFDIREHVKYAKRLQEDNYSVIQSTPNILAAFCLCFRVSVWEKIKFIENSLQFDSQFSITAKKMGFKSGILLGIYVYHNYRILSDNPTQDISHLI